jgi:hypothetical protein
MPVSEGSSLLPLEQSAAWQQHASFFDQAWAKLAARQFTGIRDWEVNYLPDATQPLPVVFYMFSGRIFSTPTSFSLTPALTFSPARSRSGRSPR